MIPKDKQKSVIFAGVAIAIAAIMAIVSWNILPDMVATQFRGLDTGAPDVPKIIAVALPFIITTIFAVQSINNKEYLKMSLIGYVANVLFWVSNMQ